MDALDLAILSLIQNDARIARSSVGAKLGLSAAAVHARIRRLERDGTIRGYLTSINPVSVKQTLLAFVWITNNSSGTDETAFEESVRDEPSVLECHIVSGEDTHMLKIRTDTPASSPGVARKVACVPRRCPYRDRNFVLHNQRIRRYIFATAGAGLTAARSARLELAIVR
jgi:Lrp/AsnC family transcriptional regulator, leucine-responsive regulatory protein